MSGSESTSAFSTSTSTISNSLFSISKQDPQIRLSQDAPDVVNAFSVLNKEDMSHGFPQKRPFERNSDFTQYNMNSESWFQFWSLMGAICVVAYWYWIGEHQYFVSG